MTTAHFHTLRVRDVRRETADCVSVAFDIPDKYRADYAFTQGQHLTLRREINGEDVRRSYSICTGKDDGEIRVAVKKLAGGTFSTFVNDELKKGDELEVMPPQGRFFTPIDADNDNHYLALVAGSGITPVMSIIKTVLAREANSRFTLVYGNRSVGSIIFRDQLNDLKSRYPGRLHLIHVLSREQREADIFNGRIDADKLRNLAQHLIPMAQIDEVFLCGPQAMIEELRDALRDEHDVPASSIHLELFGTDTPKKAVVRDDADQGATRTVDVVADGKRVRLNLTEFGQPILDAALAAGADLPFACKGGVCCTCRAKVLEGEVTMDVNYALEEDELAQGFVLTCQAHPKSDHVVVDFDVR